MNELHGWDIEDMRATTRIRHVPFLDRIARASYLVGYTLAMAMGFGMVIVLAYVVVP